MKKYKFILKTTLFVEVNADSERQARMDIELGSFICDPKQIFFNQRSDFVDLISVHEINENEKISKEIPDAKT